VAGETFSITYDGNTKTHSVSGTDTLDTIADALKLVIDNGPGTYSVTKTTNLDGSIALLIANTAGGGGGTPLTALTATVSPAYTAMVNLAGKLNVASTADFSVSVSVLGENPDGYATISGTPYADAARDDQLDQFEPSSSPIRCGRVKTGRSRSAMGRRRTRRTPRTTSRRRATNANDVATHLANNLTTGGYTASHLGSGTTADPYRVVISRTTPFTTAFALKASGSATLSSTPTSALLELTGLPYDGEVWMIKVGGTTLASHPVGATPETLTTVIDDLVGQINTNLTDGYVAQKEEGNRIVLTKIAGGSFTPVVSVTPPGTITVVNQSTASSDGAVSVQFTGSSVPHEGEKWTVTVDSAHVYAGHGRAQ